MKETIALNAILREKSGKGTAHKLRYDGSIPGVFYLGNKKNIPIQLKEHELRLLLKRKPSILLLKLNDGSEHECVVRELQKDPVSGRNIHVDLMGIIRGQKMTVSVKVELIGSAEGVRLQGGLLQQSIHEIEVECLPKDIPEKITLDITNLKIGDSLHVRDAAIENARILDDPHKTVVSILAPKIEKEPVPAEAVAVEGEAEVTKEGEEGKEETEEKEDLERKKGKKSGE